MIGLDSNILVRYLVQDDPVQSPKTAQVIRHEVTKAEPAFVSVVALAETVWVLERSYHFTASEIAGAVEEILKTDALHVEHAEEAFAAMAALKAGLGDFADALLGAINAQAGCPRTITFDRRALRLPGFELL